MHERAAEDLREARRPIASLLSKSEKAQRNLQPGTWQHTMLQDNIEALRIVSALMDGEPLPDDTGADALQRALDALSSMIVRTETALAKFAPGTSQHSLQRNRLAALRVAEALVGAEIDRA